MRPRSDTDRSDFRAPLSVDRVLAQCLDGPVQAVESPAHVDGDRFVGDQRECSMKLHGRTHQPLADHLLPVGVPGPCRTAGLPGAASFV